MGKKQTEQTGKRREDTQREAERLLTNIFTSIQDGISILDNDMNITNQVLTAISVSLWILRVSTRQYQNSDYTGCC